MNNGKGEWTIIVNGKQQEFEVECDPPDDAKRRYILKVYPKDKTQTKKEILVIMLNPSIADKDKPDPTCRALINLCDWKGYNNITICNLFSLRGPNVKELNNKIQDTNDSLNDLKLKECIGRFDEILCAWGRAKELKDRNFYNARINKVYEMLTNKKLKEFGHSPFNGDIYPNHPYYIRIKPKEQWGINEHKPWT